MDFHMRKDYCDIQKLRILFLHATRQLQPLWLWESQKCRL